MTSREDHIRSGLNLTKCNLVPDKSGCGHFCGGKCPELCNATKCVNYESCGKRVDTITYSIFGTCRQCAIEAGNFKDFSTIGRCSHCKEMEYLIDVSHDVDNRNCLSCLCLSSSAGFAYSCVIYAVLLKNFKV